MIAEYGIRISSDDGFIQINAMLDLEAEYLQENIEIIFFLKHIR